jgi:hypothetical protein
MSTQTREQAQAKGSNSMLAKALIKLIEKGMIEEAAGALIGHQCYFSFGDFANDTKAFIGGLEIGFVRGGKFVALDEYKALQGRIAYYIEDWHKEELEILTAKGNLNPRAAHPSAYCNPKDLIKFNLRQLAK